MTNDQTTPLDTAIPLVGWGDYEILRDRILCRTFGHMLRLAQPVVEEFHSDLFNDAQNLQTRIEEGMNQMETATSFFFSVRRSGTWLGDQALHADAQAHGDDTFRLYWISVWCDDRKAWHIEVEDRTGGGADLIAGRY